MAITRRIAIASEYQQTREQRIKQNLARFQKLGIKPKRTPKPFKSPSLGPTQPRRRSSRLQNPPPVSKRSRGTVVEEGANPEFDTEENDRLAKVGMPAEDPNKPKRPPCAFFVFMEDFRVEYKQKHPDNKSVAAVGKAGGEKWKSMSDAEKAPYIEEVEKRKADYEKTMSAYKKSLVHCLLNLARSWLAPLPMSWPATSLTPPLLPSMPIYALPQPSSNNPFPPRTPSPTLENPFPYPLPITKNTKSAMSIICKTSKGYSGCLFHYANYCVL